MDRVDMVIERYRAAGWIAYRYRRLRRVSLNGHRRITESEAVRRMEEALARI